MATLKAHGGALAMVERVKSRVAICADGCVLQDSGGGWKLTHRRKKDAAKSPQQCADDYRAAYQKKLESCPAFANWRALVHQAAGLARRGLLVEMVVTLYDDLDGLWGEANDVGLGLSLEDARRLADAYKAALAEAKAQAAKEEKVGA